MFSYIWFQLNCLAWNKKELFYLGEGGKVQMTLCLATKLFKHVMHRRFACLHNLEDPIWNKQ